MIWKFVLTAVLTARVGSALWCKEVPPAMPDFNVDKALGRWFYTWTTLPIQLPCKEANITRRGSNGFDLVEKYQTIFDADARDFTYQVNVVPDSPTGYTADSPFGHGGMVPVDTDYTSYMVNWWCTLRSGYVDILSRKRTIDQVTVDKLLAKMDELKIRRDKIHTVKQGDHCPNYF